MIKTTKYIWIITLITLIVGLSAFLLLPADATIPLHWDINGNIDKRADSHDILFIIPIFQILVMALFAVAVAIEPRQENIRKSMPAIQVMISSTVILLAFVQLIIIGESFNIDIFGIKILFSAIGILFVITGNYLTKMRSSFFFGIRTPWTLSSDYVWKKTHRIAGKLFVLAGAIIFLTSFIVTIKTMSYIILGTVIPAVIIPIVYSWIIWRREKANGNQQPS